MNDTVILYALRPFIGTERGQVSVGIDREVILLSDTHWYWWFVRDGKTGCEGFVPAEILELPNERLARLNRQMNIHLPSSPLEPRRLSRTHRKSVHFAEIADARPSCESFESLEFDSPIESSDSEDSLVSSLDSDQGLSHLQLSDDKTKTAFGERSLRIRAPEGEFDDLDIYTTESPRLCS